MTEGGLYVSSVSATRLIIVITLVEVVTGVCLFAFPAELPTGLYAPLAPVTSRMATALLTGGVLLIFAMRYTPRRAVLRWLLALAALPLGLLAWIIGQSGGLTGAVGYGLLALSTVALGWAEAAEPLPAALGAIQLAEGLIFLAAPGALDSPAYEGIRPILPTLGALGLVSGALLLLRRRLPARLRPWAERLAAVLPAVLVYNFWQSRAWTGALLWTILGAGALVHSLPRKAAAEGDGQAGLRDLNDQWAAQTLKHTEGVCWLLILLMVAVAGVLGDEAAAALPNAALFVLLIAGGLVLSHWGDSLRLSSQVRLDLLLFLLGVAISLMVRSALAPALLPILPGIPMVTAVTGGQRRGFVMLGTVLTTLVVTHLLLPDAPPYSPLFYAVGLVLLATIGAVWVQAATAHRTLFYQLEAASRDLVLNNDELQAANAELAAQREALAAQQDELLRQHRILVEQARALSAQRDELAESEGRFRTAFESAPIGVALVDLDLRIIRANPALHHMLGHPPGELNGISLREVTHPDDMAEQEGLLDAVRSGECGSCTLEQRYLHRDGSVLWVSVSTALVRDPHGAPRYYVAQIMDVTDRRMAEEQLRRLANFDPLTNLANRRFFQRQLEAALADPVSARGALLFLDFDDFKFVNDTLGHLAGDDLLKSLAQVMSGILGGRGSLARLGGDEFGVLVPGVDAAGAEAMAKALLEGVRSQIASTHECPTCVTVSIGIALYPDHGRTADALMLHADLAMYRAKNSGGDRYCIFSPEQPGVLDEGEAAWEQRIREALATNRFTLLFQPILDLRRNAVTQYEALLRMVAPDGALIPPGQFLPAAEACGLMPEIDRWVIRRAVETIAGLQARGRQIALSVNLSGQAVGDPSLVPFVRELIEQHEIPPGALRFEITESAAVADLDQAASCISALTELGCDFAVDDFGSGFSSLLYLKRLPVRTLKIDGGFIERLPESPVDQHLVKAMVAMARGLGIQTVAEYVGCDRTLALLRECGVDAAQGFHVGEPGPLPA